MIKFIVRKKNIVKLNKKPEPQNIEDIEGILESITERIINLKFEESEESDSNNSLKSDSSDSENTNKIDDNLNDINGMIKKISFKRKMIYDEDNTKKIRIDTPDVIRGKDPSENNYSHPSKNKPFLKCIECLKVTEKVETNFVIVPFYISSKPFCSQWGECESEEAHWDVIPMMFLVKKHFQDKRMDYYEIFDKEDYKDNHNDNFVRINDLTIVLRECNKEKLNKIPFSPEEEVIKMSPIITHFCNQKNVYENKVKDSNMAWILHLIFNDRYFSSYTNPLYFFDKDKYMETNIQFLLQAYYKVVIQKV